MGKFNVYKIPLKELAEGSHSYEFILDNIFFKDIDSPEVQKGKVNAAVSVKRGGKVFDVVFNLKGVVQVPCDRCLDDMDQEVECKNQLIVKFGKDYAEESDKIIVIPEMEGEINIAWFLYEFIVLAIPMRHIHPAGKCSKRMVSKLKKHTASTKEDEEDGWDSEPVDFMDDNDYIDLPEEEEKEEPDPRWDKLKDLLE